MSVHMVQGTSLDTEACNIRIKHNLPMQGLREKTFQEKHFLLLIV